MERRVAIYLPVLMCSSWAEYSLVGESSRGFSPGEADMLREWELWARTGTVDGEENFGGMKGGRVR